jgi:hypothetical protein
MVDISCQFVPPGGCMVPQICFATFILFAKLLKTQQQVGEKVTDLES